MKMNTIHTGLSRREALLGAAAATIGLPTAATRAAEPGGQCRRVLRLAHLTDVHVQPERRAAQGMAACLRHVQAQKDKPALILSGGDCIMDSLGADQARTRVQWELWNKVLRDECSLPIEHCIGNHDVWGWHRKESGATGSEPLYGKKWAMDALGLQRPYRSFDHAGWHFIVLDSTHPAGGTYTARLDDEQFDWLAEDLRKTDSKTPVLVLSHIPILAVCVFFDGENEKSGNWSVPGAWMHTDARRIKELFKKYPNVRLCLSGHEHLVDRVQYLSVTYVCNGAVCGNWWKGSYQEFDAGYALVDLYNDGTFDNNYVTYGWMPAES